MGGDFFKVWGSALVALTVAVAIGIGINEVTHSDHLETNAYEIEVPEDGTQVAAIEEEDTLDPVEPLMASADLAAGEKNFKRCAACHTVENGGAAKQGPNLWGAMGGPVADNAGFNYSADLAALGGDWTYDRMNQFLAKPKDLVPGTKMNFPGFKSVQDRADVIAYLREYTDNPPPIPDPAAFQEETAPAEGEGAMESEVPADEEVPAEVEGDNAQDNAQASPDGDSGQNGSMETPADVERAGENEEVIQPAR